MDRTEILRRISSGPVVFYRRVSTKPQAKGEFKHQLKDLKSIYPKFQVTSNNVLDLKETISGYAGAEKRMAGELGKGLRFLKREPTAIMVVTAADRIARTAEVFELIHAQGLGHRVMDISTGETVADLVQAGGHEVIEKQSRKAQEAIDAGRKQFLESGGKLGRAAIFEQARCASNKRQADAETRLALVLNAVADFVMEHRGMKPTHRELSRTLDEQEVRTGQGNFFTPPRLCQLKKNNAAKWKYAEDSFRRPRLRIARIVRNTLIETRRKRIWRGRRAHLDSLAHQPSNMIRAIARADARLSTCFPSLDHLPHRHSTRMFHPASFSSMRRVNSGLAI